MDGYLKPIESIPSFCVICIDEIRTTLRRKTCSHFLIGCQKKVTKGSSDIRE